MISLIQGNSKRSQICGSRRGRMVVLGLGGGGKKELLFKK